MNLPTDSQWAQYSVLCARLQPLSASARQAQIQAWQAAGAEDPQVLSLVALHCALPPDPARVRTGERLDNFTLEESLGAGGMGMVYRAQQHIGLTTRPVAVKLIHPTLLQTAREETLTRFQAEIDTLVKLEHESIARIYGGGIYEDPHTHEQLPYLAMELVRSGLSLTDYARDYALSWQERVALFLRVCRAVQYAHEHRVVHRDLKPTNILVDSEGRPFVIDFGLAHACDALLPGAPLAASGTPAYMSPEQVSDAWGTISDKSDVYALGLILYELLTEQRPYTLPRDGSFEQWRQVITEAAPPPLSQYDEAYRGELETLVTMALAKRPADRVRVDVLRSRLERYLQKLPPEIDRPLHATSQAQQDQRGTVHALLTPGSYTPEAERRQLTIMFCDLVNSTALSGQLDPEDLREVIRAYQATCDAVIQRLDGHIAQYLGDGLLVYFGYPQAHEDDARRAVRAGLDIVEALAALNARLSHGVRLAVRIGIHTGLVVVGEVGSGSHQEQLALGDTPNVAARLQGLAAPDTVVLSAATFRLIQGYFTYQEFGRHTLKGVATPVQAYRVVGESEAQTRLDVAVTRGLTPLVGREQQVGLLLECWEQVQEGRGQVVLLSGEAGIGKSRLVQVFKERLAVGTHVRVEWRCSPYYQNSALYPVIEHVQRLLQFRREDALEEKLGKLERALEKYGFSLEEVVPLFAALLSLQTPERYPSLTLTPQRQKQKTLEALLTWLLKEAERQPVCFVIEDLHWADPSTLEFLGLLLDQIPAARLLALLLFRPHFSPPWPMRSRLTQIVLDRLSRRQVETMIERITGDKPLPAEVLQHLVAKTDGVPLFVEELTKMVLESGLLQEQEGQYVLVDPLPPLAIPTTLHDSLTARLDRLGSAKQVAQLAATMGREFPYELIQAVSPVDEATLQKELAQLVDAELLYQRWLPPQARYTFKHALIQEAAYQSLLRSTRRQYHRQIAQVLETKLPETSETSPELVAHHYTEAGLHAQALPYWQQAGQHAIERSANLEATGHLTKGLEVLKTLPATPERTQHELTLQLALGASLRMIKGHTASEVEDAYTRAYEICQQVGESVPLFSTLIGLWGFYLAQGRLQKAREVGEQCLTLAQRVQDPALLQEAHLMLGSTLFYLGELVSARTHLEQAVALYNFRPGCSRGFNTGIDFGVEAFSYLSWTLWTLGYPDQALKRSHEALTLARELSHAYSMGMALSFVTMLHKWRREAQLVQDRAEAAIAFSSEQGFVRWLACGMFRRGWALGEQGAVEEGITQLCQGLTTWRAMGGELGLPVNLAMLAEMYGKGGRAEEGLRVLDEAMNIVHKNAECYYEAELYRLRGELLLQGRQETRDNRQQFEEAEKTFLRAIDVARYQHAKSLGLRAVMSLSRLWQQQGKHTEAHEMLAEIYSWFTEGFDIPDLQEAKALLEELA